MESERGVRDHRVGFYVAVDIQTVTDRSASSKVLDTIPDVLLFLSL